MKKQHSDYMNTQVNKDEIRKTFFDHWQNIEILLEFDDEHFNSTHQEARIAIINLLATGKDDIYPGTQEVRKRRVLSANEIKEEINKELEHKIKKSNLYFHLQKLEEFGFIKVVDALPYGKREIAYYGRTARVFVPKAGKKQKESPLLDDNIPALIKTFNPEVIEEHIKSTLDKLSGIHKYDNPARVDWMRDNEDNLRASEIDFRELHGFLSILQRYNDTVCQAIKEISEMLNFNQNE